MKDNIAGITQAKNQSRQIDRRSIWTDDIISSIIYIILIFDEQTCNKQQDNNDNNNNKMDECDSRYTKSAQIATRTMSINICVIKRSNVHSRLSP